LSIVLRGMQQARIFQFAWVSTLFCGRGRGGRSACIVRVEADKAAQKKETERKRTRASRLKEIIGVCR